MTILSHHKCATNWLRAILRSLAERKVLEFRVQGGQADTGESIKSPSAPRVLLNVNATLTAWAQFNDDRDRNLHFVRDPRDAFVSNYFSWLYSHKKTNDTIVEFRERARSMSTEDGMLLLIEHFPMGQQLKTWTDDMWRSSRLVKYEDLSSNFRETLVGILPTHVVNLNDELLRAIKEDTAFKRMSGRDPGVEDSKSHFRKGQAGDHQNYFTKRLSERFHQEYGWIGSRLRYW